MYVKLKLAGMHDLNNDGNYQYPRCKLSVTLAVRVVFCKAVYCSLLPTWMFLPCKPMVGHEEMLLENDCHCGADDYVFGTGRRYWIGS